MISKNIKDNYFLIILAMLFLMAMITALYVSTLKESMLFEIDTDEQVKKDNMDKISKLYSVDEDKVNILEFIDFSCPMTKEQQFAMKMILSEYGDKVNYITAHLPSKERDKESLKAAIAFECAARQEKGIGYMDALFDNLESFSTDFFISTAAGLELDLPSFQECILSNSTKMKVSEDINNAVFLEVRGTPTIFINGIKLEGAQDYNTLKNIIENEIE